MYSDTDSIHLSKSLPSRERGLKSSCFLCLVKDYGVAPFTGAWIEISAEYPKFVMTLVAPFTGAWIEIRIVTYLHWCDACRSLHGSVD